jgi:hypothetical protein
MQPFPETTAEAAGYVLAQLEAARAAGMNGVGKAHFRDAMRNLVGAFAHDDDPDPDAIRRDLLERATPLLAELKPQVGLYEGITLTDSEAEEDVNWFDLATRRSALELVRGAVDGVVSDGLLAEIDEELRRVGKHHGPVKPEYVPKALPKSHWWWRYPAS